MRIRIFIKKTIGFSFFALVVYVFGVIVYGEFFPQNLQNNLFYAKFASGFSSTRFKEVKEVDNIDILFLGSSRAYRHYDPRNFEKAGYSSYNLGSSSQTFLQTEILVKRYFEKIDPEYVILDIYPGMFSSDGAESTLDLISNDYNSWDTLKLAISLKNIKVLNTWKYAFYQEYIFNSLEEREDLSRGVDRYISGGYVERDVEKTSKKNILDQQWTFNKDQWESFGKILDLICKSQSELIVIHSPRLGYHYRNEDFLIKYLNSRKIQYHNYKDLDFINYSHFYDPSHMNQNGVELYNEFVIKKHFKKRE